MNNAIKWTALSLALLASVGCRLSGKESAGALDPGSVLGLAGLEFSSSASCPGSWSFTNAYLADVAVATKSTLTYGDPAKATNGICGGGWTAGSTDVYSLANNAVCEGAETCMRLEWKDKRVLNATGVDLVVYENAFDYSSTGTNRFLEPVIVEVSEDGTSWCGWNPAYSGITNTSDPSFESSVRFPGNYSDLAGITPVLLRSNETRLSSADLFTLTTDSHGTYLKGGGDGFDLDDADFGSSGNGCNTTLRDAIRSGGFVYVRLTTAYSRSSASFPLSNGSFDQTGDIDGVIAQQTGAR
ncbi:MAG: LIC_13355 family lipoprotein [Leptospiraceae bacterium]|nr:LIC_13355 family lipoprotein [Leptospiraceae bacterium]